MVLLIYGSQTLECQTHREGRNTRNEGNSPLTLNAGLGKQRKHTMDRDSGNVCNDTEVTARPPKTARQRVNADLRWYDVRE